MQRIPPGLNLPSPLDRLLHSTPQPLHRVGLTVAVSQYRPDHVEDVLLESKGELDEGTRNRSSCRMLEVKEWDE